MLAIEFLTQSRKNLIKEKLGFRENDPVYLQYISYFEEMDKATSVILSAMDSLGYPDESIRKMKIILTELFANAIYHGNKGDHSKKVTVGHAIDKNKVTISIMDEGDGFDPSKIPDPTLPENLVKDCGRGIFIVRSYADTSGVQREGKPGYHNQIPCHQVTCQDASGSPDIWGRASHRLRPCSRRRAACGISTPTRKRKSSWKTTEGSGTTLRSFSGTAVATGGTVDFAALGRIAFSSTEEMKKFNGLIHPPLVRRLRDLALSQPGPCILDAALIPFWHIEDWFDCCFWVQAAPGRRLQRVLAATGTSGRDREAANAHPGDPHGRALRAQLDFCQ